MNQNTKNRIMQFAFFTAIATTVYFLESMAVRVLPFPFLRIGLANVIIVYLLIKREFALAFGVNVMKTFIGGFISFSLFSPATILSIGGGIGSLIIMWLFMVSKVRFSVLGISIVGAVMHNVIQIILVRLFVIQSDSVISLMPVLMIIGIVTGLLTGIVAEELHQKLEKDKGCQRSLA